MLVSWFTVRNCSNYNKLLRDIQPFKSIVQLSISALINEWTSPCTMELFLKKHSWFPFNWKSTQQCTAYCLCATFWVGFFYENEVFFCFDFESINTSKVISSKMCISGGGNILKGIGLMWISNLKIQWTRILLGHLEQD